jgi:hypothetical protein
MRSPAQAVRSAIAVLAFAGCIAGSSDPAPREGSVAAAVAGPVMRATPNVPLVLRGDLTPFDLATESMRWERVATLGPSARASHAMVYDAARARSVLFGGETGAGQLGDTWEWNGIAWTHACATAPCATLTPAPRSGHAMAFDRAHGVTILFGGQGDGALLDDTWAWDGAAWREVCAGACAHPSARFGHAMAYDGARGRVVLFGGASCLASVCTDLGDTWEWDGTRWAFASSAGPQRSNHAMMFDDALGASVVFGGAHEGLLGDTWTWDGAQWRQASTTTGPGRRASAALAYDRARRRGALFGGGDATSTVWDWDGAAWSPLASTVDPGPRSSLAIIYDEARRRVVLFGGYGDGAPLDDTWEAQRVGGRCAADADCDTALCLDGACCASVCGACASCSAGAAGVCAPVANAEDADSCTGDRTCDARSLCLLKNGRPCSARDECASGFCVDGVCCSTACTDRCHACSAALKGGGADGICDNAAKGNDSHNDCADDGACSCQRTGACDGAGACELYAKGTDCAACGTRDSTFSSACDGFGACVAAIGVRCTAQQVLTFADGHEQDCAPYRCTREATCIETCASGDDCSAGYVCDVHRACVPERVPSIWAASCSVRAGTRADATGFFVAGLLLAIALRRARARTPRATSSPSLSGRREGCSSRRSARPMQRSQVTSARRRLRELPRMRAR